MQEAPQVQPIRTVEVPRKQAAAVLRAFVGERGAGSYAFGLDQEATVETFLSKAERHPVFQIVPVA